MGRPNVLVAVRFPLTSSSTRTVARAIDVAGERPPAHLFVLHVNVIHRGERVTRDRLRRAVEREFGPLAHASYHVREAYRFEEAILTEIVDQDVDCVVIGRDGRGRWRRAIATRLDLDVDLETYLARHLDVELVVA